MTHHFARQMKQTPAHSGHFVFLPAPAQHRLFKEYKEIVRDDANAEESRILATLAYKVGLVALISLFWRGKLSTRHPFHAKADLEFLDAVLGNFTALAIPEQRRFGRLYAIAGNDMNPRGVVKQLALTLVFDHNQTKRFLNR